MPHPRIIFACPFPRDHITGGIKTVYQHAEWLAEAGINATVFSPDGTPTWLNTRAEVNATGRLETAPDDIVVLGETLDTVTSRFLGLQADKRIFCQNQFYVFNRFLGDEPHSALGISEVYGSSLSIQDFFAQIYKTTIRVVPYAVDPHRFKPSQKRLQIAFFPKKRPFEAQFIQQAFRACYPAYRSVPFREIHGLSEEAAAEVLAESAILLALGHLDSFGLPALEGMASGCAVVGFHGIGGQEFARPDNGLWFDSDQLLAVVHALARVVQGVEHHAPWLAAMIASGQTTAAQYSPERARAALLDYYSQ